MATQYRTEAAEHAGRYLEKHGYVKKDHLIGHWFVKGVREVVMYSEKVSFRISANEGIQPFYEYTSLTGIDELDIDDWKCLFHIAEIVKLQPTTNVVKNGNKSFDINQLAGNVFGSVKTVCLLIVASIILLSCNTERQLQIQKGIPEVYNGHVKFNPVTKWEKMEKLPDTLIAIRNTSVKKDKN